MIVLKELEEIIEFGGTSAPPNDVVVCYLFKNIAKKTKIAETVSASR